MLKSVLFSMMLIPGIALGKQSKSTVKQPSNKCKTLQGCVNLNSILTGNKYFYSGKLKGEVSLGRGLFMTKENSNKLLAELLNSHGYTRVSVDKETFKIVSARDIRYTPTELIRYRSSDDFKNIPALADYFMLSYQLKNSFLAKEISRSLRPFLSRYGRIIENRANGRLVIQDTGNNLRRITGLISELDTKLSDNQKEILEDEAKKRHEINLVKAKNCSEQGGRARFKKE